MMLNEMQKYYATGGHTTATLLPVNTNSVPPPKCIIDTSSKTSYY